jgi:hypothetical protein
VCRSPGSGQDNYFSRFYFVDGTTQFHHRDDWCQNICTIILSGILSPKVFFKWRLNKVGLSAGSSGPVRIIVPGAVNFLYNIFDIPVHLIPGNVPILFKISPDKKSDRLVETGIQSALVFLDDFITVIARLTVDQFHQDFALMTERLLNGSVNSFFSCFSLG